MAISREEQERRYQELMGQDALDRQKRERKTKCSYCGSPKGQHLNLCPYRNNGRRR